MMSREDRAAEFRAAMFCVVCLLTVVGVFMWILSVERMIDAERSAPAGSAIDAGTRVIHDEA